MAYYRVFAKPTQADYQRFRSQQSPDAIMQGAETFEDWVASGGRGKLLKNTSSKNKARAFSAKNPGSILDFEDDSRGGLAGAIGGAVSRVGDGLGNLVENPGFLEAALVAAGGLGASSLWGPGATSAGTTAGAGLAEEAAMLGVGDAAGAAGAVDLAGLPAVGPTAGGVGATMAPMPAPAAAGGAATGGAAAVAGGSALQRIMDGTATSADWLEAAGIAGATGLGYYGAGEQADALRDIAGQSREDRKPFYDASVNWLNDPMAYAEGPGKTFMDATLRRLSADGAGNPIDQPTSMGLATQAGLQDWRDAVTGFANIGLSGEDSRNNLLAGAAGAEGGQYDALGYGLGRITQPRRLTLADVMGGRYGLS